MPAASKIFKGYRALGYVTNHVPLAITYHRRHQENYVVTCVGRSFHTYNCSRLGIVAVSDLHPADITCLAVDGHRVFTGCENVVRVFKRGKQVEQIFEGHSAPVHILLPFGDHLISVDTESCVIVWDLEAKESLDRLYVEISFDNATFEITAIVHPNTYLNKVLFGSRQGTLQLWNIKTSCVIHTFSAWRTHITVLEQAPAVDVIAIGLADGQIIVHNIKYDESIVKFKQEWGPVTGITFRTDGQPLMVTGSAAGHIALWDLEGRRLKCQLREAHHASVTGLQCLASEPLLITSASDNCLKVWIFDMSDGGGRLLKQRAGHSAPPNRVRHYGHDGHNILSAGQDSTLQSFSTVHDSHNKSLGRASFDKSHSKRTGLHRDKYMMSPIIDFAAEAARESDWDNIVAVHRGLAVTTTWTYQRSTMGNHKFLHERFNSGADLKDSTATCLAVTGCGNFSLIGYSSGHIDVYNLQSGLYRGSFGAKRAHKMGVRSLVTDGLNQITISAGGEERQIKVWRFHMKDLLAKVVLKSCVSQLILHRESSLLAVAHDDFIISVVDINTRVIVREFTGHSSRVTDMCFSPDCRWLISSSMDGTIRTWDMPSACLIDCFSIDSAVTSLTFSPTADFLVTSHVDDLGLYLWSNMTLYNYISLQPLPDHYQPPTMERPVTARSTNDADAIPDGTSQDASVVIEGDEFKSAAQISDELITLSLLPESRWRNLLQLDIIKRRNAPKEPPRAPRAAPFFLPTIQGLDCHFDLSKDSLLEHEDSSKMDVVMVNATDFGKSLLSANSQDAYMAAFGALSSLGPSSIDTEIRSLSPDGGGSVQLMHKFLACIGTVLQTNRHYEIAQAFLGLFLKIHGESVIANGSLVTDLREIMMLQSLAWMRLQELFEQSLCLVTYTRSATL